MRQVWPVVAVIARHEVAIGGKADAARLSQIGRF